MTLHLKLTILNFPGKRTEKTSEAARRALIMDAGQAQRNIRVLYYTIRAKNAANMPCL